MTQCNLKLCSVALVALLALAQARADVVTDWNATALGLTTLSPPPAELRALAITHAAMFDAVNAITRSHAPYLVQPTAPAGSSADAAAASAAHGVLLWLFPGAKTPLDAALAASLGKLADGAAKDGGLALGKEVAGKYITARTGDGIDRKPDYRAGSGPGSVRGGRAEKDEAIPFRWDQASPLRS